MKTKTLSLLLIFLTLFNVFFLTGCWDSRELNEIFVVTGLAVDMAENDKTEITVQVGKTQTSSSSSTQGQLVPLNLSSIGSTVLEAFYTINKNSSRYMLVEHNQVLLVGQEVAERSLQDILDVFIRVQEARIETPVAVIEGKAKDILTTKFEDEQLSSLHISKEIRGLSTISKELNIRIIDLMHRILSENGHEAILPIFKIVEVNEKPNIVYSGVAVFKFGKMVGRMSIEEGQGYGLARNLVSNFILSLQTEEGKFGIRIQKSQIKTFVEKLDNDEIKLNLKANYAFEVEELVGYENYSPENLVEILNQQVREKVLTLIMNAFAKTQELNCDIYGFGEKVWQKYPKLWERINWNEVYSGLTLNTEIKVNINSLGDILQNLEMEENIGDEL